MECRERRDIIDTRGDWPPAAEQVWNIFVLPEVERRAKSGDSIRAEMVTKAQVLFFADGRAPSVRLEQDVRAIARVEFNPGVAKKEGDPIYLNEVASIRELQLPTDEDPDCGHITMVRFGDWWLFAFDVRYRKGTARQFLTKAGEFLDCSASALRRKHWHAFIDNLFSATELIVKAELGLMPVNIGSRGKRRRADHGKIAKHYSMYAHLGNAPPRFTKTLKRLNGLRRGARYESKAVHIEPDDARRLQRTVREMVKHLISRIK